MYHPKTWRNIQPQQFCGQCQPAESETYNQQHHDAGCTQLHNPFLTHNNLSYGCRVDNIVHPKLCNKKRRVEKRGVFMLNICRGSGIRTHDLFNPIEARYQAAPCPERLAL